MATTISSRDKSLAARFEQFFISYIGHEKNIRVDSLTGLVVVLASPIEGCIKIPYCRKRLIKTDDEERKRLLKKFLWLATNYKMTEGVRS